MGALETLDDTHSGALAALEHVQMNMTQVHTHAHTPHTHTFRLTLTTHNTSLWTMSKTANRRR